MNTSQKIRVLKKSLVIKNKLGLHARCAAKIAQEAQKALGNVTLSHNGTSVDAKSLLDILTLAVEQGKSITLCVENPQDACVLDVIAALVDEGFGEADV